MIEITRSNLGGGSKNDLCDIESAKIFDPFVAQALEPLFSLIDRGIIGDVGIDYKLLDGCPDVDKSSADSMSKLADYESKMAVKYLELGVPKMAKSFYRRAYESAKAAAGLSSDAINKPVLFKSAAIYALRAGLYKESAEMTDNALDFCESDSLKVEIHKVVGQISAESKTTYTYRGSLVSIGYSPFRKQWEGNVLPDNSEFYRGESLSDTKYSIHSDIVDEIERERGRKLLDARRKESLKRAIPAEVGAKYLAIAAAILDRYSASTGDAAAGDILSGKAVATYYCWDVNEMLEMVSDFCRKNGELTGSRICQDWPCKEEESIQPLEILSEVELDDLSWNYELHNSEGKEYEKGYHGFHDEMMVSFAISVALDDITKGVI